VNDWKKKENECGREKMILLAVLEQKSQTFTPWPVQSRYSLPCGC